MAVMTGMPSLPPSRALSQVPSQSGPVTTGSPISAPTSSPVSVPTLTSVEAPSSAPVGAPSSFGVEIFLATSITLIGLQCADYDASAEAALIAGLAACVDVIAAEDMGSTECADLGGGGRALLMSSANISFILDVYSSSPATEFV